MRLAPKTLVATILLSAALTSSTSSATVVVMPTMEEMTLRSDVVVQGVVREVWAIKDEKGRVITNTAIEVIEGLKGNKAGDVVTIQQLGGSFDGQESWIAGNHRFKQHEEVVLFAVYLGADRSILVPYGIGFSVFDVLEDVDGKHAVEVGGGDVTQMVRLPSGQTEMRPVTPRRYASVEAFKTELRAILDGREPAFLPQKKALRQLKAPAAALAPHKD